MDIPPPFVGRLARGGLGTPRRAPFRRTAGARTPGTARRRCPWRRRCAPRPGPGRPHPPPPSHCPLRPPALESLIVLGLLKRPDWNSPNHAYVSKAGWTFRNMNIGAGIRLFLHSGKKTDREDGGGGWPSSMELAVGPIMVTSVPGSASHRK